VHIFLGARETHHLLEREFCPRRLEAVFPGELRWSLNCPRGSNRRDETVSFPGNRLDQVLATKSLKDFAQCRNVVCKITFFDNGLWPQRLHQIFFGDQMTVLLYEHSKSIEDLSS
jgi:hypothetical protein